MESGPECESPIKEAVEDMGSVLVKLKMHSQTNCLLSLGISYPWEGQSFQGQQALRYQNLKIQKIKKHVSTATEPGRSYYCLL